MGQTRRPSVETLFSRRFHLRLPLIVAPMAGVSTAEFVAHASNAGAIGSLACAYQQPEEIEALIEKTNLLTSRPYSINLFTRPPDVEISPAQIEKAFEATAPYRKELGLSTPNLSAPFHPDFDRQFEVILRARPAIFSFVFGKVESKHLDACRSRGILTMGAATTLDEALQLVESGVDAMVLQGTEAGGHRAIFSSETQEPGITTRDLLASVIEKVKLPIIAAGGIMNGADIAYFIKAGAAAVQMGTAFLLTHEAGTSKPYREILSSNESAPPELTRAFSGRLARGIPNRFQTEAATDSILPYPAQNAFTRDLRSKSASMGSSDFISAWAGSGVKSACQGESVTSLILALEKEALAILA